MVIRQKQMNHTSEIKAAAVPQVKSGQNAFNAIRTFALLLCFGCGLFGVSALVRMGLPFPPVAQVQTKEAWLDDHLEDYDTIFVGSSRAYHQIIPELFDQLMAKAGMPTHSFNLGIDGMVGPEDSFLLETVLAKRKKPLKLVLLECGAINTRFDKPAAEGAISSRQVYWHDFQRFALVAQTIFASESNKKWPKSFAAIRHRVTYYCQGQMTCFLHHLHMHLCYETNFGRGCETLTKLFDKPEPINWGYLGPKRDGYLEILHDINDHDWAGVQSQVADYKIYHKIEHGTKPSQMLLLEKRQDVQACGGKAVFFVAPSSTNNFYPSPKIKPEMPVIDLSDPARYPEFFERSNRCDGGHLNAKGSEILTRRLVEQLALLNGSK